MKFGYICGQKPLEGYEIKRGIGRGGFGEVYFGLSDGGKEVALKVIQSNLDIELRGIHQCLNLKHPNLVHLYDLKTDGKGDRWLVMEYVAGESMSTVLSRHPTGVAPELACEWFQGLAAAIHYLHDHGIVHRDLKPGNIFLENGTIKVGDYGLCKLLGGSQRIGQTQSIGTVHYMAPEISTGNYNRQIDIYAAGVILYEMLTGQVPFEGETAGEILMKHLTCPPDLSKVPAAFAPILDRALAKNPEHRYQTIAEMGKKVASMAAKQAEPVEIRARSRAVPPPLPPLNGKSALPAVVIEEPKELPPLLSLSCSLLRGLILAGIFCFVAIMLLGRGNWQALASAFYVTVLATSGVLIFSKVWAKSTDESWHRRISLMCFGVGLGLTAMWLDGFEFPWPFSPQPDPDSARPLVALDEVRHPFFGFLYPRNSSIPVVAAYLGYFGLMFFVLRWWKLAELYRPSRFSLQSVIAAAFWAYILLFLLPATPQRQEGFVSMVLAAVIVQLVSPWRMRLAHQSRRLRLRVA